MKCHNINQCVSNPLSQYDINKTISLSAGIGIMSKHKPLELIRVKVFMSSTHTHVLLITLLESALIYVHICILRFLDLHGGYVP